MTWSPVFLSLMMIYWSLIPLCCWLGYYYCCWLKIYFHRLFDENFCLNRFCYLWVCVCMCVCFFCWVTHNKRSNRRLFYYSFFCLYVLVRLISFVLKKKNLDPFSVINLWDIWYDMFAYKKQNYLKKWICRWQTHTRTKKNTNINNLRRRRRCSKILQAAVALVLSRIMP